MKKVTQVTTTKLVLDALRSKDDFLTIDMLMAATGRKRNQVHAALWHMRNRHAVDVIVQDGTGWWFARPTEDDNRSIIVEEKAEETRPRKPRKRRTT